MKKDQEQQEKTIIKLNMRVARFHKYSITFWAKAASQPKNKRKSAPATQLMGITDLGIISVLLLSKLFSLSSKFKINSLKFAYYWKQNLLTILEPNSFFYNVICRKTKLRYLNLSYDLFNRNLMFNTICIQENIGNI